MFKDRMFDAVCSSEMTNFWKSFFLKLLVNSKERSRNISGMTEANFLKEINSIEGLVYKCWSFQNRRSELMILM